MTTLACTVSSDPKDFQFDLDPSQRPSPNPLNGEAWFPHAKDVWPTCTSRRIVDPTLGIRTIVIHATAGSTCAGAFSVMKDRRASFHWLIPNRTDEGHGAVIWATAPETRACWHVRNSCAHPAVFEGRNKVNHSSLGIEIVNKARPDHPYSAWQIAATAEIIRYAWAKYPNLRHVVSHARLDPGRRTDPGMHFPWALLERQVLGQSR